MTGNLHDLPEGYSHVMLEGECLDAANELRAIQQEKKYLATREAECKRIIEKHLAVGERGITPDGEELVAVRVQAVALAAIDGLREKP